MVKAEVDLWVLEAQAGDRRAFEKLFGYFNPAFGRFAYRLCGDHQMARDSTQDAWIEISRGLKRVKDPKAFRSWAYRMVRWRTTDQMRKINRSETDLKTEIPDGREPSDATPDQMQRLIQSLPAEEASVLSLFYQDELGLAEIAVIMEVPVGTIKSRLFRARARLRQQIEGEINE